MSGANLAGADLSDVWMEGTDLSGGHLIFASLPESNLGGADLTDTFLWNTNMESPDLTGANLSSAFLGYANLTGASLRYTNLTGANLGKGEDLSCETCPSANLTGATLTNADLTGANLTGANLTDSLLDNAIFSHNSVLHDGQTVSQWGFDESGLQAYLEGTRSAFGANNLTIVPAPSTLSLLAIGGLTVFRRRRASFPRHS